MKTALTCFFLAALSASFAQTEGSPHGQRPSIPQTLATLDIADQALQRYQVLLVGNKMDGGKSSLPAADPEGDYANDLKVVGDGRKLIAALKAKPEQISTPLLVAVLTELTDSIENVLTRSARLEQFSCSVPPRANLPAINESLLQIRSQLDDAESAMISLVLHWSQSDVDRLTNLSTRRRSNEGAL